MITASAVSTAIQSCLSSGLTDEYDTAFIVVNFDELATRVDQLMASFPDSTLHAVAVKTNPHPAVLHYLVARGCGLEAASFEELELANSADIPSENMVFDSPVKTQREIDECSSRWPGMVVNSNSLSELDRYNAINGVSLGLRINPVQPFNAPALFDVSAEDSKFGVALTEREEITRACKQGKVSGLHVHCGSSVTNIEQHAQAIASVIQLADELNENSTKPIIRWIDIGGGLHWQTGLDGMAQLKRELEAVAPQLFNEYRIVTEFGQWIHATSSFVVSKVEYFEPRVERPDLAYIHVGADLFMRDVYSSSRDFRFIVLDDHGRVKNGSKKAVDIAGPLCFAGDFIARGIELPQIEAGDHIAILDTGANTLGLWSRHCSRKIPKVIGYDRENLSVLSERQSLV